MKPVLLYLVIVEIATGKHFESEPTLYQSFFHQIVLSEKDLLNAHPTRRIHGGEEAAEKQFPFMVFVVAQYLEKEKSCCSGTIISKDWVLVSAHCLDFSGVRPENIILAGGKAHINEYLIDRLHSPFYKIIPESTYGVQERRARNFFLHPHRSMKTLEHDIGLVKLARRFSLKRIKTIRLASDALKLPIECTLLGWGISGGNATDGKLKFIANKQVTLPQQGCLFKEEGPFICMQPAGGGICQGDSGSPLLCNDLVYGIASHVVAVEPNPKCGTSSEEYYAALYPDLPWIRYTMSNYSGPSSIFASKFNFILIVAAFYILYVCWSKNHIHLL